MAASEQQRRLGEQFEFPQTVEHVEGSGPRNMVVLLLDSLNRHMLGAYGGDEFETPNLDRLAARSLRCGRTVGRRCRSTLCRVLGCPAQTTERFLIECRDQMCR